VSEVWDVFCDVDTVGVWAVSMRRGRGEREGGGKDELVGYEKM